MNKSFAVLIVVVTLLLACNSEAKYIRDIKRLTHQTIDFPKGYVELTCNSQMRLDSLIQKDVKIVSYYGDIVCTSCCAKSLKRWQDEIKEIDENVAFVIIARSVDNKAVEVFSNSLDVVR